MVERVDAVIAGVNKAGTTSLFVSLAEHPDVVASAIKETRYFSPVRYGQPVAPVGVWNDYFTAADRPVRLEATPSYFYGGAVVARAMKLVLVNPRVVLVLREPVSRAISFFEYQKVRMRFHGDLTIEEYLTAADGLTDAHFNEPEYEKFMAEPGGRYADWLPDWWDVLGSDAVKIVFFEDLIADGDAVLREVAEWLGLDVERLGGVGARPGIEGNAVFANRRRGRGSAEVLKGIGIEPGTGWIGDREHERERDKAREHRG